MGTREEGVTYPRDVPLDAGMPAGWKGVERLYGEGSKSAGKTYIRYYSLDERYKHVCSPKQVITMDCESKGTDPGPAIAEYLRLQKERHERRAEVRRAESEAKGQLKGQAREDAIAKFNAAYGSLSGPIVSCFPGWVTRWHYQPNCGQVMVEYLDTEGNSWKLLKDLEAAFQFKLDTGAGGHVPGLLETGTARADPARFAEGAKNARATGGMYEISADASEGRSLTQEDRLELSRARQARPAKKRRLTLGPEGPGQEGWAALETRDDLEEAFARFRDLLARRGFKNDIELVSVYGVSSDRFYARRLRGVYYQLGEPVASQSCYQKLLHFPECHAEVGCDGIYIQWSAALSRWEITTKPSEEGNVIAHSAGAAGPLTEATGPWRVQDGQDDFREDEGLAILQPGSNG